MKKLIILFFVLSIFGLNIYAQSEMFNCKGASVSSANGVYSLTEMDTPNMTTLGVWSNGSCKIFKASDGTWKMMDADGNTLFVNNSGGNLPPSSGWQLGPDLTSGETAPTSIKPVAPVIIGSGSSETSLNGSYELLETPYNCVFYEHECGTKSYLVQKGINSEGQEDWEIVDEDDLETKAHVNSTDDVPPLSDWGLEISGTGPSFTEAEKSYRVSNAGKSGYNGDYSKSSDDVNEHPSFQGQTYSFYYSSNVDGSGHTGWTFDHDYRVISTDNSPPLNGWQYFGSGSSNPPDLSKIKRAVSATFKVWRRSASQVELFLKIITNNGGDRSDFGICYGTTSNPTINDHKVASSGSGSATGTFPVTVSGLTAGQSYHFRSYTTNSAGTSYGENEFMPGSAAPGKCLYFPHPTPSSPPYIDLDDSLDFYSDISIESWAKWIGTAGHEEIIIGKGSTASDMVYNLGINSSGKPFVTFVNDEGTAATATGSNVLGDKWTHLIGTWDRTTVKLYKNGMLIASASLTGSLRDNSTHAYIGCNNPSGSSFWEGYIDDPAIWGEARTQYQIRNLMCQELNPGVETELLSFWTCNNIANGVVEDKANNDDGRLHNSMTLAKSGAPIGTISANDYNSDGGYSASITSDDGDSFTATTTSGTVSGIHVYMVCSYPEVSAAPGNLNKLSNRHYFGVFAVGTDVQYTATYNYDGHPGISDESKLDLAKRSDNSVDTWTEANATLNTSDNTLTLTGQTGTEYILGDEGASQLPVELTTFTATERNNIVTLKWKTATEVNNYGFQVQRKKEKGKSDWEDIGFVEGHGNSNSPKEYSFKDENPPSGEIQYRLKQIDIDGAFTYSNVVEVENNIPSKFELFQNYPNPFNPTTIISYSIPASVISSPSGASGEKSQGISPPTRRGRNDNTNVTLKVYDVLGCEVATLVNEKQAPGNYTVKLNARNLPSGIYFYSLNVGGKFVQTKKMLFLK